MLIRSTREPGVHLPLIMKVAEKQVVCVSSNERPRTLRNVTVHQ